VRAPQQVLLQVAMVQQLVDEHAAGGADADEQDDVGVVEAPQNLGLLQKLLLALEAASLGAWVDGGFEGVYEKGGGRQEHQGHCSKKIRYSPRKRTDQQSSSNPAVHPPCASPYPPPPPPPPPPPHTHLHGTL